MIALPKLMVAPNGARKTKADHPALPITMEEIVAEAVACHAAGADGLHLHVRDADGGHTLDAGLYTETLTELRRAVPDMALQITTEAVEQYTPAEQRAVVDQVKPEAVSVSLAEMCADGDIAAAVAFYARCAEADIAVQHILYGPTDLALMSDLLRNGRIKHTDLQLLFVLGRYSENQQSTPEDIAPFATWRTATCPESQWAVCAFGRRETDCLVATHRQGGHVRVGFENSVWNADGTVASSNAERVAELRKAFSTDSTAAS